MWSMRYAKSGRPFLVSLHFNAPHWPWEAPGDEAESQRLEQPVAHFDGGTQRTYQRMIQQMDLQIGRVLQALDANGADGEHDRHLHQRQRRRALSPTRGRSRAGRPNCWKVDCAFRR